MQQYSNNIIASIDGNGLDGWQMEGQVDLY
jgi:hypothetical protein